MELETLLHDQRDSVVTLTINRPDRANTLSPQLIADIHEALDTLEGDPDVRAIILTGAGRHFCGGADLREAFSAGDRPRTTRREHRDIFSHLEAHPQPIIAAINGVALGGGCEVALACDLRLMAAETQIGTPEIKFGTLPLGGGTQRLARMIGVGNAKQLVMLGEPIGAQDALRMGLVNCVVPGTELLAEANRWADLLASRAPFAHAAAKQLILRSMDVDLQTGLMLERTTIRSMATPEQARAERDRAAATQGAYSKIFQTRD